MAEGCWSRESTRSRENSHESQEGECSSEEFRDCKCSFEDENIQNQEVETLEEFIETITDDEISQLQRNDRLFKDICAKLLRLVKHLEIRESIFEQFLAVIKKLSIKSENLLRLIEIWLPQRQNLLRLLREDADSMEFMTKWCNMGRLLGSVVDSAGLIGSLVIRERSSHYATIALEVANTFGFMRAATSVVELFNWKTKLDKLMKELEKDQHLFSPIQEWFQQSTELKEVMTAIFPFDITSFVAKQFDNIMQQELSQSDFFELLLGTVLRSDSQRFRDVTLIRNLVAFTACLAARDCCWWIILRHHKVSLDIESLLLQLINPQRFAGSQNIALQVNHRENPVSISVIGRLGLNVLTIYDAINALKNDGMVEELRQLLNHLQQETAAITQIAKLVEIRRPK